MLIRYIVILSYFILFFHIYGQNTPVADAGADQNVAPGATVTLDGSGSSDADSDPLTYTWTEVSNFGITFTSPSPSSITFTLPNTLQETDVLTFRLVVDDNKDGSSMDEVVVFNFNSDLLSELTLTERISATNIVHLDGEGYDKSSAIFAGKFNTSSASPQVIYESGGGGSGTALLIDDVGGQLSFVVSTGSDNDVDISSAININTDYVYIVEITGATDGAAIHLYITEGTSFSDLDSVTRITNTITSSSNDLDGGDGPGYLSSASSIQGNSSAGTFEGTASEILFFSNQRIGSFDLNLPESNLLSSLTLTETIDSDNIVHLENEGYSTSSIILAGGFSTSSNSTQLIYEAGGATYGTVLLLGEVSGQLTFVVSTGSGGNIDISSAINRNTDYVYIVEITGAVDNSVVNLYIAEGKSLSVLDSVTAISGNITSIGGSLAGADASSYLVTSESSASIHGDDNSLGTIGDFQGIASEIFLFSNQSIPNILPTADAGANQNVSAGSTVTLDGSGSSAISGQSVVSYTWSLLSGSGVTIADPNVASFSFTLPDTIVDTETLTFGLVVSDGINSSVMDKVIVSNFNSSLLSGLTLTEKIDSSNIVHLENEGYDQLSMIFAGSFNTTSNSSQVIYEAGGGSVGTALRIDDVAGQLTFVVSTGSGGDIDISSAININTDYVYIVEITGATDNSAIHLYIAEGTSFFSFR